MESQPQNPEFRNNPETFRPCTGLKSDYAMRYGNCSKISNTNCLPKGPKQTGHSDQNDSEEAV